MRCLIQKEKYYFKILKGATLIELVVAIALVGVMVIAFAGTLSGVRFFNESKIRYAASILTEKALDALRAIDPNLISDQAAGPFLGVLINHGVWKISATGAAPSSPNILAEQSSSPSSFDVSGILVLSSRIADDVTAETKIKWSPDPSATGTPRVGFILRGRDAGNGYFFSIEPTLVSLEKRTAGIKTSLASSSRAFSADTWYTIKAAMTGNTILIYVDGAPVGSASDSAFTAGEIALFAENALLGADNVTLTGDLVYVWNFDAGPVGSLPANLQRVGFGNLPQGRGTLTVENAFSGINDFKKATARVYWTAADEEKSVEAVTFIQK
ncbi:hypothetical protein HYT45_01705 [Candidatus Uhrbacteria bacterium]|nr:hypothetical protein [Candidatus Uhrbacteria bacterium]